MTEEERIQWDRDMNVLSFRLRKEAMERWGKRGDPLDTVRKAGGKKPAQPETEEV